MTDKRAFILEKNDCFGKGGAGKIPKNHAVELETLKNEGMTGTTEGVEQ